MTCTARHDLLELEMIPLDRAGIFNLKRPAPDLQILHEIQKEPEVL